MKNRFLASVLTLLLVALTASTARAQIMFVPNLIHLSGTTIVPNSSAWTFGGSTVGTVVVDGVRYAMTNTGIQQAINACVALGTSKCNTVFLSAGTYTITDKITPA